MLWDLLFPVLHNMQQLSHEFLHLKRKREDFRSYLPFLLCRSPNHLATFVLIYLLTQPVGNKWIQTK